MIRQMTIVGVGPAKRTELDFGTRLNVFTGDNGLGKSFVLDCAWWALTGSWPEIPALPDPPRLARRARDGGNARKGVERVSPQIRWVAQGKTGHPTKEKVSEYDRRHQRWKRPQSRPTMPGLIIYARVDGSFSVWDPARNYWRQWESREVDEMDRAEAYHFSRNQVWNGLELDGRDVCNGLIRDWVSWQREPNQTPTSPFRLLCDALDKLSPHLDEHMQPGEPRRVYVDDARDFPTIRLPYGTVPVTHVSAGMRRILALAYLVIWAWSEHVKASELIGNEPDNRLMLLVDEVETHLHPEWQRRIVPAVLAVLNELQRGMQVQALFTTHAPLVLASLEPQFDPAQDEIFSFVLEDDEVQVNRLPWVRHGDALGWLLSEIFGLRQARSVEAEEAIEAAEAWMRGDRDALPPAYASKQAIDAALRRLLSELDPFWPRWIVARERSA